MKINEEESILSVSRLCQKGDITFGMYAVLAVLHRVGKASANTIQKKTGLKRSSLYHNLELLCRRGMVKRGSFEKENGKPGRPAEIWCLSGC